MFFNLLRKILMVIAEKAGHYACLWQIPRPFNVLIKLYNKSNYL
ncbi:AgrD family cyclic lactone autoinducer peptide [Anaerofustis stercorihominis]|uniref:Cyclic lactone autoinducer peptide n=1 Tax=Anaerofustis stercorihominis TaxID=214853 RepID=A0A3E3DYR5_9FIRM|nr:cyclic lactone autoinducer peptide [Anaerofustis stercorihominis]